MRVKVYIDGASKGNPGPSAVGIVIKDEHGNIIEEISEYISSNFTNNEAEYHALIKALQACRRLRANEVMVYSDSTLLIRQVTGEYKVREPRLRQLYYTVKELERNFGRIIYNIIPREENRRADTLAKNAIPEEQVLTLNDLNGEILKSIVNLYRSDPFSHAYLMYDILYNMHRIKLYLNYDRGIRGYLLEWHWETVTSFTFWGECRQLVKFLPRPKTYTFINLQMEDEHLIKAIFEKLKGLKFKVKTFIDMATDEDHFNSIIKHKVRKLTIDNLKDLLELRKVEGRLVTERTVAETLRMQRCYGIFENGKLVSVAHTYVRLPEIWIIGGVYTRPEYRGRGYATSVTSAVTRDAVQSGALAMLHVAEGNPAYRIYERIGYREVARRKWIIVRGP